MQTLSKKAVQDFKNLYFQEFGIRLTDDVAKKKTKKLTIKDIQNRKDFTSEEKKQIIKLGKSMSTLVKSLPTLLAF